MTLLRYALLFCAFSWHGLAAEPIRVACLGDSITAGAKVNAATESYPVQLQQLLGPDFKVKNFGVGGATMIRQGRPNVFQELPAAKVFLPQVAIVSFGINDTRSRDVDFWSHFADFPGATKAVLDELIALPSKPRVLLCLPTENVADLAGMPEDRKANVAERLPRLVQVRDALRAIAKDYAARGVTLVNLQAVTVKRPDLFNIDGVHLNAAGYKLLAETLQGPVRTAAAGGASGAAQP